MRLVFAAGYSWIGGHHGGSCRGRGSARPIGWAGVTRLVVVLQLGSGVEGSGFSVSMRFWGRVCCHGGRSCGTGDVGSCRRLHSVCGGNRGGGVATVAVVLTVSPVHLAQEDAVVSVLANKRCGHCEYWGGIVANYTCVPCSLLRRLAVTSGPVVPRHARPCARPPYNTIN